ncbi:MAG: UbiA family prenyltransferase [Pseudomonadota bacterium]
MTLGTLLRLGRVSNLPTVWTNALAGAVLASDGAPSLTTFILTGIALTLFYEGGMWLNDAFDAEIDARERANRPIPNGEVSMHTVFTGGFAMLAAGIAISFTLGIEAGFTGIALAVAIVAYDALHKKVGFGPVMMGATRYFSYSLAAVAVGVFTGDALWGALGLFAYIIGLTYAAKQEAYDRIGAAWPLAVLAIPVLWALEQALEAPIALVFWAGLCAVVAFALHRLFRRQPGDVPKAVVTMIAGISLYDAALIASTGATGLAALAAAGFALTLALQRVASGT